TAATATRSAPNSPSPTASEVSRHDHRRTHDRHVRRRTRHRHRRVPADPTVGSDLVGADPTTLSVRILAEREAAFDPELGSDILRLLEPADIPLSLVSSVDARLGRFAAA